MKHARGTMTVAQTSSQIMYKEEEILDGGTSGWSRATCAGQTDPRAQTVDVKMKGPKSTCSGLPPVKSQQMSERRETGGTKLCPTGTFPRDTPKQL